MFDAAISNFDSVVAVASLKDKYNFGSIMSEPVFEG